MTMTVNGKKTAYASEVELLAAHAKVGHFDRVRIFRGSVEMTVKAEGSYVDGKGFVATSWKLVELY